VSPNEEQAGPSITRKAFFIIPRISSPVITLFILP